MILQPKDDENKDLKSYVSYSYNYMIYAIIKKLKY